MKFGKEMKERVLAEWRFYAVDYKAMKKCLSDKNDKDEAEFFRLLDESKAKLAKFYSDKEKWALGYMDTLEERVEALRETSSNPGSPDNEEVDPALGNCSDSSLSSDEEDSKLNADITTASPSNVMDISSTLLADFTQKRRLRSNSANGAWLKSEYRKVAKSKNFKAFIYAKKSLTTFDRELDLLLEFLSLNKTAFAKILKKFDKRTGSNMKIDKLADLRSTHSFLDGVLLSELKDKVVKMIDEVNALKPTLPEGWEDRKVYTIGCFDLFHRGHQNVLLSLREFGYFIVAGIHDDASYFKLKNKYTIDNLEKRMENVKPFVDQLFVIPSTEPLNYIKNMVSEQDIETGACCYARGDDMLAFPGRDWVESVMPVHFVPRTESCSSTLIRTIYHAEDEETRKKAAFAKTRYDGKPVDEEGNVLKLHKAASCPAHMHSVKA